jgi:putative transposase
VLEGPLEAAGVQPSMSRPGCPYDNAMAESFMKTLTQEEVDAADYRDLAHATAAIGDFIEAVHNLERLHSALDYLSPTEFEAKPKSWAAAQQPMHTLNQHCPQ